MGNRVRVDDRGRITIPTEERSRFGIKDGDELELLVEKSRILRIPVRKKVQRIKRGRKWGEETFLSSGTATFGD